MSSNLSILYKAKRKYNSLLEEISKLNEKHSYVLSRSNYYFWEYGNNKTLSKEEKSLYFQYVKTCDNLMSLVDEKLISLYEEIGTVVLEHDEAAKFLVGKRINIQLLGNNASGGASAKDENCEEDIERNILFKKILDEIIEDNSQELEEELEEESYELVEEYVQDIDSI